MKEIPAYRKKYIPGEPGPHLNPWIIDVDALKKTSHVKGNITFFVMLLLAALIPMYLCDFDFSCGASTCKEPMPKVQVFINKFN